MARGERRWTLTHSSRGNERGKVGLSERCRTDRHGEGLRGKCALNICSLPPSPEADNVIDEFAGEGVCAIGGWVDVSGGVRVSLRGLFAHPLRRIGDDKGAEAVWAEAVVVLLLGAGLRCGCGCLGFLALL